MTTEDDFQNALAAAPRDWQTLLVFADWLQENGDTRAEGYRAMGMRRAAPSFFDTADVWVWLNSHHATYYAKNAEMRAATLPDDWYDFLPRAKSMTCAEERRKLNSALNDAARAFAKLPSERRVELLVAVPEPPKKKPSRKKTTPKKPAKPKAAKKPRTRKK